MKVISGCLIEKDNKILMVKEANPICYGKWNFPAGVVDEGEKIKAAAIREVFEETGCKVELKSVLPIVSIEAPSKETHVLIRFVAEIIDENIKFNPEEILDVKWMDIDKIKEMTIDEIRGYDTTKKFIEDFENNNTYSLEMISDLDFPNR